MEIVIENANDFEMNYDVNWTIERFINGKWKKVYPNFEESSNAALIVVDPHHSITESVDLESYLADKLITGKYRIIKQTSKPVHRLGVVFEIK